MTQLIDTRTDIPMLHNVMPLYQCHKIVRSMRITAISEYGMTSDVVLNLVDEIAEPVQVIVPGSWVEKHKPQVGGYFVLYEDDYYSFSPANTFIGGYHRHEA